MIKTEYIDKVLQAKLEVTEGHFYIENMAPVLGVWSNYGVKTYDNMLAPFDRRPYFIAEYEADNKPMGDFKEFCVLQEVPIQINEDNTIDFIKVWKFIPAHSTPVSDKHLDRLVECWALEVIEEHEKQMTGELKVKI